MPDAAVGFTVAPKAALSRPQIAVSETNRVKSKAVAPKALMTGTDSFVVGIVLYNEKWAKTVAAGGSV